MKTRHIIRTALALGFGMLALSTTAWAGSSDNYACQYNKFNIRYYSSGVDTYHHKHVTAYCEPYEKAISCEAEVYTSSDYSDEHLKYFVALNEMHPYKDKFRYGCWARANTFYSSYQGYHGEPSEELSGDSTSHDDFHWGLKVYATCVPKDCVVTYKGEGSYDYYQPDFQPEE